MREKREEIRLDLDKKGQVRSPRRKLAVETKTGPGSRRYRRDPGAPEEEHIGPRSSWPKGDWCARLGTPERNAGGATGLGVPPRLPALLPLLLLPCLSLQHLPPPLPPPLLLLSRRRSRLWATSPRSLYMEIVPLLAVLRSVLGTSAELALLLRATCAAWVTPSVFDLGSSLSLLCVPL